MVAKRTLVALHDDADRDAPDLGDLAADVGTLLGRDLTAYVAGADSPRELDQWTRDGDGPARRSALERLRTAFRVIEVFAGVNRASLAAGWLCDPRATRGGASPAQLIRDALPDSGRAVLAAARRFAMVTR